jgi:hypothetical protein
MGKTLRKFSNKDKKTKRKRSYKKGGGENTPTWRKAVKELDVMTNSFKREINNNNNNNNNDVGKLETTYNELERYLKEPKQSCREKELLFGRAPLIGDTKNGKCEAYKYGIYYRLHAFLVEKKEPEDENIKEIKKRVLELINQKMNIRVNQAFNWINNIVSQNDYDEFFGGEKFRRVLTDKDNFNRLNRNKQLYLKKEIIMEDGYKETVNTHYGTEFNKLYSFLIENKENYEYIFLNKDDTITELGTYVNKEIIKKSDDNFTGNNYDYGNNNKYIFTEKTIEQSKMPYSMFYRTVKLKGYKKLDRMNESDDKSDLQGFFENNKDNTYIIWFRYKDKIEELGKYVETNMEKGFHTDNSTRYIYTFDNKDAQGRNKEFSSSDYSKITIFYKGDESTGGKKKYKKSRKTARRGRKTSGGMLFSPSCKDERSLIEVRECLQGKILRDLNKTHDNDSQLKDWQMRIGDKSTGPIDTASDTYNKIDKHFRQLKQTISINNPDDKLKKLKFLETDRILEAYIEWQVERLKNKEGQLRTELRKLSDLIEYIPK